MILNEEYYRKLWEKFEPIETLNAFNDNTSCLTTKIILDHYRKGKPLHVNFQNSKQTLFEIGRQLFIELANDIYRNHYDLPRSYNLGDKLKRIRDNKYYEITKADGDGFNLTEVLRKRKKDVSPAILIGLNFDRLAKYYVKIDTGKGISEKTIKSYFNFFEKLNNEKSDFPKINFEMKSVFIAKKPLWDSLNEKSKIPSTYYPNPREENEVSETKSIAALSNSIIYFTPKYDVCYRNILQKGEKIKTIVIFDTEGDKIPQILQNKVRFGFNLIILSNSYSPLKNESIPCWNWFKEEIEIVDAL